MNNRRKKINLLIDGTGDKNWIGGLYHKRNILYSLLSNENIAERIDVTVITQQGYADIFAPFQGKTQIKQILYKRGCERTLKLVYQVLVTRANFVFPSLGKWQKLVNAVGISWIPDFQHNRLREFFSQEEYDARTASFQKIAQNDAPLILSSHDCYSDFREFYTNTKKHVYVVPFVSYIEPEIKQMIESGCEKEILDKFELSGKNYVAVMNQFWQHKNHRVIFDAMRKYFADNPDSDFYFVFTGTMKDYRNPEHIEKLQQILREPQISKHVKLLGFIDRTEQLAVMKNAQYIIQPSLFEGWGTVVEDAKVLDKTILLSDIPIHREQKNEKCILFDPYDAEALCKCIEVENGKVHKDDIDAGLADMHRRAFEYSRGFEKLFSDMEK